MLIASIASLTWERTGPVHKSNGNSSELDSIEELAGAWVLRSQDGLTPAQEGELSDWLAADFRHRVAFIELKHAWARLEPLAAQVAMGKSAFSVEEVDKPVQGQISFPSFARFWRPALAAAAALVIGVLFWRQHYSAQNSVSRPTMSAMSLTQLVAPCEQQTLEDGSIVQLNRGAQVNFRYTEAVRMVELIRGEAHFKVAKNPMRPFVVKAGGVDFRAVGTAFDVRLESSQVEILVTEGKVRIQGRTVPSNSPAVPHEDPLVVAGQSAAVLLAGGQLLPKVVNVTGPEMEAKLAWRPKMLEFDDTPLSAIVDEFNRHNPVHIVVVDPTLGSLRMTASFRSDNMEGFVRLIESSYGVRAGARDNSEIVLTRK
jgi:transmembrane sensor